MTFRTAFIMLFIVVVALIAACTPAWRISAMHEEEIRIIPRPQDYQAGRDRFTLTKQTTILVDPGHPELLSVGEYLAEHLRRATGLPLPLAETSEVGQAESVIVLTTQGVVEDIGTEGYTLVVERERVTIRALQPAGVFYGVQSLRQLLPPEIESRTLVKNVKWSVPELRLQDRPHFPWRGMLLDCCRHFMDKEFVKRYIDLLAYHKMNRFHWHLTEDQGWRIEILKYPRLTEIGAWRKTPAGEPYGGYYTQDEIREVVAYAASRYVTVVPEIEMPGHSVAALAAYPELSCRGEPLEVETRWGVHKDVYCAGNTEIFPFLEDVLTEVMELFPGAYIHIGGDECPKARWRECDKCQAVIAAEGLTDENELQSWFIQHIERFLDAHGRKLIGWDEILEGGLSPGATVQSWRGKAGAVAAAEQGHDAIVSPTSHAYFDYDIGVTDLRQVLSFDPVPAELSAGEHHYILGGECNMWSERAPQETVDSKVFPRLLAMAERLWRATDDPAYDEFYRRVRYHYRRLELLGVSYGPEARPLTLRPAFDPAANQFVVTLQAAEPGLEVHYSLDRSEPTLSSPRYAEAIRFHETTLVRARAFRDGYPYGAPVEKTLHHHAALGKRVVLRQPPADRYAAGGAFELVNGARGSAYYLDGFWLGFEEVDFEALLDLGDILPVRSISCGFLQSYNRWIFLPPELEFAVSTDGDEFRVVGTQTPDVSPDLLQEFTQDISVELEAFVTRYIRIHARNRGTCPPGHPGAGGKAWLFVDEIQVR